MTDTAVGEAARAERGEGYAVNAPYYDLIIPREHWSAVAGARSRAEVVGDGMIRWINTYRTLAGDRLVREETAEFDCHVIPDETLAAELTAAGLEPAPAAPPGLHVWRR
ncbi:hypothetical protein [Actinomadura sp. 21ATH]|uniref:hypothetical protein n=1 Tax=Actinomadura sp. 21ATH TaxID=1735444 RepID=UPI0035BED84B